MAISSAEASFALIRLLRHAFMSGHQSALSGQLDETRAWEDYKALDEEMGLIVDGIFGGEQ